MGLSPAVARGSLLLAACVLVGTLAPCYGLWMREGCLRLLPYLSDLGVREPMRGIWLRGLVADGALQAAWLLHVVRARCRLLHAIGANATWVWLNALLAVFGVCVVCGTCAIGFFPWNESGITVYLHFVCADSIFFGGCAWALGSALLGWRLSLDASLPHGSCRRLRRAQWPIAAACPCALYAGLLCLAAAHDSDPDFFGWGWWDAVQKVAREDFGTYCGGERSWHALAWVNRAAFVEWLLLALLFCSSVAAHADCELYFAWRKGCGPPPPPGASEGHEGAQLSCCSGAIRLHRWQARVAACTAVCALGVCICGGYAHWLGAGCVAFLPSVSELDRAGEAPGHSRVLLPWGTLLAAWLWHVEAARHQLIRNRMSDDALHLVHGATVASGVAVAFGLSAMGLLPWHRSFLVHISLCMCTFAGGCVWATGGAVLSFQLNESAGLQRLSTLPGVGGLHILAACGMFGCVVLIVLFFCAALHFNPSYFTWGWWNGAALAAQRSFGDFCGSSGLHGILWIDLMALAEWGFMGWLLVEMLSVHVDSELHYACNGQVEVSAALPSLACLQPVRARVARHQSTIILVVGVLATVGCSITGSLEHDMRAAPLVPMVHEKGLPAQGSATPR